MNHCVLEVEVMQAPTLRYTQDNQTPIAEMDVRFDGLRAEDAPGQLKVVGWGNLAQDLQNRVQIGQRLLIEGRLRMNTVPRQDGTKEKRAEFTLSRLHPVGGGGQAGGASKIELSSERVPHPKSRTTFAAGEKLVLRYAGGGGFGDPTQRPIEEVEQDVRAGYVSLDKAAQIYGKSLAISEQDENG